MINKCQFLEFAISKFTKFGSKKFTLDELAREMGISKKTIYKKFSGKEAIVNESLILLLEKIEIDINKCIEKENSNPILAVIGIYRVGLDYLKTFSPSFLYGLQKYYPKANREFSKFRKKQ
ncbi:TetR/AcrR family transcriptional regulator [Maribacter vaceletii]|uniref:TetR/AcrR family transcriptional regulator n=1 Tax=Maribacter vaceletii TaxID=1206816 RepID=UPI000EADBEEA|nr:TetR/AcrR family transcriptional regulator [Maribacter vaceletii]